MRGICMSCGGGTNKGNSKCDKCQRRDRPRLRTPRPRILPQRSAEELARHKAGDHSLCSPERYGHGVCSGCGKVVAVGRDSRPSALRRCRDCQRARPAWAAEPETAICQLCEQPFTRGGRSVRRFCSQSCAASWGNGARPPYTRPADGGYETRKAARGRHRHQVRAQTYDGVTNAQILERDRWRCGICRQRIGKSFKWPHPRSASIDHIVPLSQGGDDSAANKRAAHLGCNCRRMNRGGGEQLAMIG